MKSEEKSLNKKPIPSIVLSDCVLEVSNELALKAWDKEILKSKKEELTQLTYDSDFKRRE